MNPAEAPHPPTHQAAEHTEHTEHAGSPGNAEPTGDTAGAGNTEPTEHTGRPGNAHAPRSPRSPQRPEPSRLPDPADELLDVVDEQDRVVGQAPRGEVYAGRLRHRCVFIQVRDAEGRLFVHRRTATKLVFPSMYDMFVGGVVGAGESYDDAALREAEEELGVTGLPRPVPVLTFLYGADEDTGPDASGTPAAGGTWWSRVYEVRCDLPVRPQPEEVAWHAFLSDDEVDRRVGSWPWVPDGLAAYRRLRDFRARDRG